MTTTPLHGSTQYVPRAPESRPPRPQLSIDDIRVSLADIPVAQKKASRRWIVDLMMVVVGALVGIYAGSATLRTVTQAYAANALKGQFGGVTVASRQVANAAVTAADSVSVSVQRPLAPDLNRTASGAEPIVANAVANVPAPKSAKPSSSTTSARGRRPGGRK